MDKILYLVNVCVSDCQATSLHACKKRELAEQIVGLYRNFYKELDNDCFDIEEINVVNDIDDIFHSDIPVFISLKFLFHLTEVCCKDEFDRKKIKYGAKARLLESWKKEVNGT